MTSGFVPNPSNGFVPNPSLRTVVSLVLIVMGVTVKHLPVLLILLGFGQLLLLLAKVPFRSVWKRIRYVIPFLVFTLLFFPFYESADRIYIGIIPFSIFGLYKAAVYCGRLLFTLQILTLLFHRLPLPIFFQALVKLRIPGILVELITFTLRFMDVIRDEALRMMQALKSRGMRPKRFFSLSQFRVLAGLLGMLLLRSLRRSERITMSMMSRGYQGIPMTHDLPALTAKEGLLALIWVLPAAGIRIIDFL